MDRPPIDPEAAERISERLEVEVAPAFAHFIEQLQGMTAAMQPFIDNLNAQMAHLPAAAGPVMGELESVTETCACHCWQNHPGAQGVCEAASVDGAQIDGKPACFECAAATAQD